MDPAPPSGLTQGLLNISNHIVIEEIARGGMGIVYRARQTEPAREVALKMLLPHQLGSAEMRERFRLEAQAIAGLEHPAILPVYQVGDHEGLPYFTMKLAAGGTLASCASRFRGRFRETAQLMVTLAEAVHFAHERGVLHRDLKPGNILFDESDRPYVSDFGLAKLASADAHLTRSVDFLGTPHYVAPEVASRSAREATIASDIYSLGAILYELLAGRPPFEAEGIPSLLKKITEDEPARPSKRTSSPRPTPPSDPPCARTVPAGGGEGIHSVEASPRDVPYDLEVICLKCLAKEPPRRYATAGGLAEDLCRWLTGKPITARPVSRAERVSKWIRRNPMLAALAFGLTVSVLGGGLALWRSDREVRVALGKTRQAQELAQDHLREALLAQAQSLGAAHSMGQRWQALDALARAARIRPGLDLRNEVAAILARLDLRELSRFPATISDAGSSVVFTSDLDRYVTPEPAGGFALRATKNHQILASFAASKLKPARWFVLSPDNRMLGALMDDYQLGIWSLTATEPLLHLQGTVQQTPVVEFHPDGVSMAAFVPEVGAFLQRLDGRERRLLQSTNGRAVYLRFDPVGQRLGIVRDPGGVELWRADSAPKLLWFQPMRRAVPWLAWSPDGRELAVAADDGRGLRILSAADGQTKLVYSRHLLYPRQFEFSPNGRIVASLGQDWVLRLWDARTGQDLVNGVGRHRVMRFSQDGQRLVTAPTDRELAVLQLAPELVFREFSGTPVGPEIAPSGLEHNADGHLLIVLHPNRRIYDTVPGRELSVAELPPEMARFSSLSKGDPLANHSTSSADGFWTATASRADDLIKITNLKTGQAITNLVARAPDRVWFSPDNHWLVASVGTGYQTWATSSWSPGAAWEAHLDSGDPGEITFSDDSRLLVARHERAVFELLSFPECRSLVTLKPPLIVPVRSACLRGDGSRLWLLAGGYRVFEWNLSALEDELAKLGLDWGRKP